MPTYLRLDAIARENNSGEAKKYKHLDWYKCPFSNADIIVQRLARHKNGHKFLNLWRIMAEVSCENPNGRRGFLAQKNTPYTPEDLEIKTGWKAKDFAEAIAFFSAPDVGWMVSVPSVPHLGEHNKKPKSSGKSPEDYRKFSGESPEDYRKFSGTEGEGEGEGEGDNTPLPPDCETPASTEDEGEGLSQEDAETRHHREYCRKEAKGLPQAFLDDQAFRDAWCDWLAHLQARHHKGLRPPFTTIDRHKRQIAHLGVTDAVWALEEAMRRNLAFPADPAKRPAPATTGGVWDGLSVPATPEQRAAQAVMPRPFRNPFASDKPTEPIPEISAGA